MKLNFFFAWTQDKDKSSEYTKSIGGGFNFPPVIKWLKKIFTLGRYK